MTATITNPAAPDLTGPAAPDPAGPAGIESAESCAADQTCIDGHLWSFYERTPKVDTVSVAGTEKVTVKRKGKTTAVTKSTSKVVGEDFAWKDPKAAEVAGMSTKDFVIGGMDSGFRLKLYRALRALDDAGFKPGINCGFRDDYRQSIATGLKARNDRSYHGGSFRGGYGHGVAADIVSVRGETREERLTSSQLMWDWIDAHESQLGIGRPYRDRDPPHVGPLDGQEYAEHRLGRKDARADAKARKSATKDESRSERKNGKNDGKGEGNSDRKSDKHGRLDAHGDHRAAKPAAMKPAAAKPAAMMKPAATTKSAAMAKPAAMTRPARAAPKPRTHSI